jgi:beta-glucosidase
MEDGPQGVADGTKGVTCWPSALTVTQSWDSELFYNWSYAMGIEQKLKGSDVMLGPMMNLARVPLGEEHERSVYSLIF